FLLRNLRIEFVSVRQFLAGAGRDDLRHPIDELLQGAARVEAEVAATFRQRRLGVVSQPATADAVVDVLDESTDDEAIVLVGEGGHPRHRGGRQSITRTHNLLSCFYVLRVLCAWHSAGSNTSSLFSAAAPMRATTRCAMRSARADKNLSVELAAAPIGTSSAHAAKRCSASSAAAASAKSRASSSPAPMVRAIRHLRASSRTVVVCCRYIPHDSSRATRLRSPSLTPGSAARRNGGASAVIAVVVPAAIVTAISSRAAVFARPVSVGSCAVAVISLPSGGA